MPRRMDVEHHILPAPRVLDALRHAELGETHPSELGSGNGSCGRFGPWYTIPRRSAAQARRRMPGRQGPATHMCSTRTHAERRGRASVRM
ncbi:hypothetical protein EXIGLDRAFT_727907, partial [Exidia glandulosa HHB12029]